jgi:hypothetical protein
MASFSGGGTEFPPLLDPNVKTEIGFWMVIETVEHDKKATELPLFTMKKFIEQTFPGTSTARPTKEGKLLVIAKTRKIFMNATKVTMFYNICKVKISAMDSMNTSVGSVYGRELLQCTVEELNTELKGQGIVNIERAMTMKGGILTPNGLHIITFDTNKLPSEMYIGYMRYTVRTYYPRPLRCSKCCIFGHSRKRCEKNEEACRTCKRAIHIGFPCAKDETYCRNCEQEGHGSFDKECPKYLQELAIVRVKVDRNISYGQARALFNREIERTKESYISSFLESLQKNARESAMRSERIQELILQQEQDAEKLEKECQILEKNIRDNEERRERRDDEASQFCTTIRLRKLLQQTAHIYTNRYKQHHE